MPRPFKGLISELPADTQPWDFIQALGLLTLEDPYSPYSGEIRLIINDGGIRNKMPPVSYKNIFREVVLPAIHNAMNHLQLDKTDSFVVNLRLRNGILKKIFLEI